MPVSTGDVLGGMLAGAGYIDQVNSLMGFGDTAYNSAQDLASQASNAAQFIPFTVTGSQGGTMGTDQYGNINMQLSPEQQALQNSLMMGSQQAYNRAMADPTATQQDYYSQAMQLQQPQLQADRLAMENRLAAQGRQGLRTAQYGGSPEMYAQSLAESRASNQAAFDAMKYAQDYQTNQANLAGDLLTGAYVPQASLMDLYGEGRQTATLADLGRRQGAGYMADLGMAGLDAQLQSQLGAANLYGQGITAASGLLSDATTGVLSQDFGDTTSAAWDWFKTNILGL